MAGLYRASLVLGFAMVLEDIVLLQQQQCWVCVEFGSTPQHTCHINPPLHLCGTFRTASALATTQKSPYVERCMRFFGAFAAKTPANDEAAAALVEELLSYLAGLLSALDKAVRYRNAQLLQQLLAGMPASLLLEDSVAELLRESLQERLQDKQPAVRAEACRAVSHLLLKDEVSKQGGLSIVQKPV